MNTATTQAGQAILFRRPFTSSRPGQARDRWALAILAGLLVAMLALVVQRVDPQTLEASDQAPALLSD